jgi:hypothetical protein
LGYHSSKFINAAIAAFGSHAGEGMKVFLLVIAVAALFVLGPVLAMRPSPRQAQLARLRARALGAGLRVRVNGARTREGVVDYVLPWRLEELPDVRGLRLVLRRVADGSWEDTRRETAPSDALRAICEALPAGVSELRIADEGVAAQWGEKGRDEVVDRIGEALLRLRETVIAGAGGRGAPAGARDIRT